MLDKMSDSVEKDILRLGIEADVQWLFEGSEDGAPMIRLIVTFDSFEDMHLYKMLGVHKENYNTIFEVNK